MNFLKYIKLYIVLSAVVFIPGIISLIIYGINPSIDFIGGSLVEVRLNTAETPSIDEVQATTEGIYQVQSVQQSGDNQFLLKGETISNDQKNEAIAQLNDHFQTQVEELRFETIGPTLSRELLIKTLVAVAIVSVVITLFVARQFKELKYGVAAIVAMFHDTAVLVGLFSLFGYFLQVEVDVLFVTALLTTLSFSVHDTIVVFDRIRELRGKNPRADYKEILNTAITETLSRSINNSMTIIIMLVALSLLGGETIRWFSIALLIGSITGTYSSPFVAVPLLLAWDTIVKRKRTNVRQPRIS